MVSVDSDGGDAEEGGECMGGSGVRCEAIGTPCPGVGAEGCCCEADATGKPPVAGRDGIGTLGICVHACTAARC